MEKEYIVQFEEGTDEATGTVNLPEIYAWDNSLF